MFYPFKPTKGVQFTLYFSSQGTSGGEQVQDAGSVSVRAYVSKNGGALTICSNSVTRISDAGSNLPYGYYSIVLTASEMNADSVVFSFSSGTNSGTTNSATQIQISTDDGSGTGGATAQQIWEYATRTLTSGGGDSITVDELLDTNIPVRPQLPKGDLTIRQIFELMSQRFYRNNPRL